MNSISMLYQYAQISLTNISNLLSFRLNSDPIYHLLIFQENLSDPNFVVRINFESPV